MKPSAPETGLTQTAPGEILLAPVVVASALLLGLNDHFLKAAYHNDMTGKLSDFAGLVVLPCVLLAMGEWAGFALEGIREGLERRGLSRARNTRVEVAAARWRASSRAALFVCSGAGFAFAALKLSVPASDLYCRVVSALSLIFQGTPLELGVPRNVVDPTDLVALPALLIPFWLAVRRGTGGVQTPEEEYR